MAVVPPTTVQEADSSNMTTYIVFGIISIVVYVLFLKPLFKSERGQPPTAPTHANAATAATGTGQPAAVTGAPRVPSNRQGSANNNNNNNNNSNSSSNNESCSWLSSTRKPSHATKTDAVLVDGMISFRHSTAASYEASLTVAAAASSSSVILADNNDNNDTIKSLLVATNRKERAKILSRIVLTMENSTPPPRGSNVVVSIPSDDVDCPKLRRILYLLATYLTVIVVLSVSADATEEDIHNWSTALRGSDDDDSASLLLLPAAVLPAHRIVAAQSRMGRIALVRQLGRVEFVLDHEPEMKEELGRFGFQVICYDNTNTATTATTNDHGENDHGENDHGENDHDGGRKAGVSRLAAMLMD